MADLTRRASYIASPTIQLRELTNIPKLEELNEKFIALVTGKGFSCTNFMEGSKTKAPAKIKIHVVPPEYAG